MPTVQARFWSWTLNNYDEAELVSLRTTLSKEEVRYACFGKETGKEEATPHLQGYIAFGAQKTKLQCKGFLSPRAHVEVSYSNEDFNVAYCSKQTSDDNPLETFGVRDRSAGKRTDLESFKDAVKGGCCDYTALMETHSKVCAQYPRFVEKYIRKFLPKLDVVYYPLFLWQSLLTGCLALPPNDREIVFVVDPKGNSGKTYFVSQYLKLHPTTAIALTPGKSVDVKYAFYSYLLAPRVVFFDAPRYRQTNNDSLQPKSLLPYDLLEEFKNGRIMNTKYNSEVITFPVPHVVVFTNREPDMDALSLDRYVIIHVERNTKPIIQKFS